MCKKANNINNKKGGGATNKNGNPTSSKPAAASVITRAGTLDLFVEASNIKSKARTVGNSQAKAIMVMVL